MLLASGYREQLLDLCANRRKQGAARDTKPRHSPISLLLYVCAVVYRNRWITRLVLLLYGMSTIVWSLNHVEAITARYQVNLWDRVVMHLSILLCSMSRSPWLPDLFSWPLSPLSIAQDKAI